jgi:tetratricopeptide (TPR) repeat protein
LVASAQPRGASDRQPRGASAQPSDVVAVEQQLARLADAGQFVRAAGVSEWSDGTVAGAYSFTHSMYQTVLRERVPPARQRQLHGAIALRLEAAHGRHGAEGRAELAYHFEKSGDVDRSLSYLEDAAARALRRGAGHEAVELLQHGLALVEPLAGSPERTLQTIRLHLALGTALPVLRGLGDPAAEQAVQRARALSEQTNDYVQLVQALAHLVGSYLAQARVERASEAAEAMRGLMATMPIPPFIAGGNILLGMVEYYFGKLKEAEDRFEQVLAMGDVPMPPSTGDLRVLALGNLAITHLQRGYPDKARSRCDEAMQRAADTGRPFDRGLALQQHCFLLATLRDTAALREVAGEARAHATEHDVAALHAASTVHGGRIIATGGDYESGTAMMAEGIAAYRASGQRVGLANMLSWLAEVHIDAGNAAAAAPLLAEALAFVAETGVLPHAAELHRLDGELQRLRGDRHAAEHSFRRAIDVARDQDARWWELRATVSLARLQQRQRKSPARAEARDALAAIVGWFTEGFDTIDVQEARALLNDLS